MTVKLFEVGGCVRDSLLGIKSKDIDFAVEAPSFDAMREFLQEQGFLVFLETPEYFTIRARFPSVKPNEDSSVVKWTETLSRMTADFVLCRKDGEYTDGRRPDDVSAGTLMDDLARRDFTVNAIARSLDGHIVDPFDGQLDLKKRLLRCVGSAEERFTEDALRALRAIRFSITKGFKIDDDIKWALHSDWLPPLVAKVSAERRREELHKCMFHDTNLAMLRIVALPDEMREAIFSDGLWMKPTLEKSNNMS